MTQRELAEQTGIRPESISKYYRGRMGLGPQNARRIAQVYEEQERPQTRFVAALVSQERKSASPPMGGSGLGSESARLCNRTSGWTRM
jgi:transcriptional regulator with XRE-family HTH domain